MIEGVCLALVVVLLAVSHLAGRRASANALLWTLENDPVIRRDMLERLAKLEGVRLVGRE